MILIFLNLNSRFKKNSRSFKMSLARPCRIVKKFKLNGKTDLRDFVMDIRVVGKPLLLVS